MPTQTDLFGHGPELPPGFKYEYGWRYDFGRSMLEESDDVPDFLMELREVVAPFAGMLPETLQQVLVTEYEAGAGIGWHKDKGVFGEVVGVSLLSSCTFRLR